ncbi:MAG: acylneuraminate cytidylyltransferase family protein [Chloroflexota bacterium]
MVEVLAIIPARGGSKSIPRKNIRYLAGHPLIAYSIAAGLAARTVTRLLVSTDDGEIAAVAKKYGAEVPFLRPAEHSQDNTPDMPVFRHALEWLLKNESYHPEILVQLRPTSPFRRVRHIDDSVRLLLEHPDADAARTVCIPFQNPFKMWRISPDGLLQPLGTELGIPYEPYNQPRQALPDVYWQTGYVDACRVDTILNKNSMTGRRILPVVIDPAEWIDIDSPDDWQRAERLLENGDITLAELGFKF